MIVVEIDIPGRAMPWHRPHDFKGRRLTSEANRIAIGALKELATRHMAGRRPVAGAVRLEVVCVYAIPAGWNAKQRAAALDARAWHTARPDWDNLGKLISDALNGIVYKDDCQIADGRVAKRYGQPERTMIRVTQIGDIYG